MAEANFEQFQNTSPERYLAIYGDRITDDGTTRADHYLALLALIGKELEISEEEAVYFLHTKQFYGLFKSLESFDETTQKITEADLFALMPLLTLWGEKREFLGNTSEARRWLNAATDLALSTTDNHTTLLCNPEMPSGGTGVACEISYLCPKRTVVKELAWPALRNRQDGVESVDGPKAGYDLMEYQTKLLVEQKLISTERAKNLIGRYSLKQQRD